MFVQVWHWPYLLLGLLTCVNLTNLSTNIINVRRQGWSLKYLDNVSETVSTYLWKLFTYLYRYCWSIECVHRYKKNVYIVLNFKVILYLITFCSVINMNGIFLAIAKIFYLFTEFLSESCYLEFFCSSWTRDRSTSHPLVQPDFGSIKLTTSRSWQYTSCHWDTCSNHLAISDFSLPCRLYDYTPVVRE